VDLQGEGGQCSLSFHFPSRSPSLVLYPPPPMKNKKELTAEAGQQPRCQRFPLTSSSGGAAAREGGGIKRKKQRNRESGREMGENESALAANPKAAYPSSATFALIPVCANPGQVEMEFDKREIDSQASDAGVTGSCGGDRASAERHAITPT